MEVEAQFIQGATRFAHGFAALSSQLITFPLGLTPHTTDFELLRSSSFSSLSTVNGLSNVTTALGPWFSFFSSSCFSSAPMRNKSPECQSQRRRSDFKCARFFLNGSSHHVGWFSVPSLGPSKEQAKTPKCLAYERAPRPGVPQEAPIHPLAGHGDVGVYRIIQTQHTARHQEQKKS